MSAVLTDKNQPASKGLFRGIAVVIDDGIANGSEDAINDILATIKAQGGHTVQLGELPSDEMDLAAFSNAAFFIMDWNLKGTRPGVALPKALLDENVADNIKFLRRLSEHRHAPVFIFTHDDIGAVEQYLRDAGLYEEQGRESHILVKNKLEVKNDVYGVLEQWLNDTPSALVLKQWERSYIEAVNALFMDFHDKNAYWPLVFWDGFKTDKVPPDLELGNLVTRLVISRMKPLAVNLDPFMDKLKDQLGLNSAKYEAALYKILQNERFLPNERLDPDSYAPGDLFYDDVNNRYLLNIRAECDCVVRGSGKPVMYVLKGREESADQLRERAIHNAGAISERDNEAVLFALFEGKTLRFGFKDMLAPTWKELKDKRKGRVLPPFITRLVQRYASYSQRPGLPRIPAALMPPEAVAAQVGAEAPECECDLEQQDKDA